MTDCWKSGALGRYCVRECRDPKDDKCLEVGLNGRADVIVTGDADLLGMHPWRGIAILSPKIYVAR